MQNLYHYWREIEMSCLHNEEILENLFEQIQEEYPTLNENEQVKLAEKMFDDLCQLRLGIANATYHLMVKIDIDH